MNAPRRCFSFSTYFTTKKLRTRVVDQQHEPTLGSPQVEYELLPTDLESSSRWAVAKVLPNGGAGLFFGWPKKIQLKGKEWEDARIHWHLLRDGLLSPPGWTPNPRDPRKVSSHSECLWHLRWPERSEFVGEVLMWLDLSNVKKGPLVVLGFVWGIIFYPGIWGLEMGWSIYLLIYLLKINHLCKYDRPIECLGERYLFKVGFFPLDWGWPGAGLDHIHITGLGNKVGLVRINQV